MSVQPLTQIRVLYVDDDAAAREAIRLALRQDGRFRLIEVDSLSELDTALVGGTIDMVLSEIAPFGQPPLQIIERVRLRGGNLPIVLVAAQGNEELAVAAIKRGASDYLAKKADYLQRVSEIVAAAAPARALLAASQLIPGTFSQEVHAHVQWLLDGILVRAAFLDNQGYIHAINGPWKDPPSECVLQNTARVGANILDICRELTSQVAEVGEVVAGIRRVLSGQRRIDAVDYPFQAKEGQQWCRLGMLGIHIADQRCAILLDVNVTSPKMMELERDRFFDQTLSLLCIAGYDGFLKRWNPALGAALGYSHDELMATPLPLLLHPDDLEKGGAFETRLKSGERVRDVEVRVRCQDGSYKWTLFNAVPDVTQQVYFVTGQDITARKLAESKLAESEERFRLIGGATQECLWDWDLRENRIWRNEAFLQIFGAPNDALESPIEWWRVRIHPSDLERVLQAGSGVIAEDRQQWTMEYRLRRLDGSYAYVYDRGFMIFDRQGEPVRMVGSLIDVTELRRAAEQLSESEERFRLAAKATRDAIWDWDMRSGLVWRSEGFQSLFGYRPEAIRSDLSWWIDRVHADDRSVVFSKISATDTVTPAQGTTEYRFRRADGTYADVFERAFVIYGPEGKPVRMVGSMMDISERRRAEQVAHMQRAELAHIARISTMGEIATGLAHELNQPLAAIGNYAESCTQAIAANLPERDQKLLTWIEKIAANTHRAGQMIRRLRNFTRKSELRRSTVEIKELVNEVLDLLEVEMRLQNMRVRWETSLRCYVVVDRIQIQQVLINLVRNAFDALSASQPRDRLVVIAAVEQEDQLELLVEDRGEGIREEHLEQVFDAFFTTKANGMGIGLAISRSIIEEHGGRLWVVPNPGRGVTFHFTLPKTRIEND